jgi:hypothetical protein
MKRNQSKDIKAFEKSEAFFIAFYYEDGIYKEKVDT